MIRNSLNRIIFKIKNPTCKLGTGVIVSRKTTVGKNCHLARNCKISTNVILGNNVRIGAGTSLRNITIGDNSMLEAGVMVVGPNKGFITIGKECYIGVHNVFDTSDDIYIGDYVHIAGPSTGLWGHSSAEMCINSIPLNDQNRDKYRPTAPVKIESNVYIGGNCTIYPGVTIRHHSIIAPNSAVSRDVMPNNMVGGVPAKLIKNINIE